MLGSQGYGMLPAAVRWPVKHRLDVRYTQSSGLDIAYTVLGQGPLDVVFVPGFASHLHRLLVDGAGRSLVEHLSSVARLIVFDKRGTGLSDRTVPVADLDARMDDLRAVMDAAHADKAVLFGLSEGGPMSILFASSFPDRVVSLVLWAAFARRRWAPDFPMGVRAEA